MKPGVRSWPPARASREPMRAPGPTRGCPLASAQVPIVFPSIATGRSTGGEAPGRGALRTRSRRELSREGRPVKSLRTCCGIRTRSHVAPRARRSLLRPTATGRRGASRRASTDSDIRATHRGVRGRTRRDARDVENTGCSIGPIRGCGGSDPAGGSAKRRGELLQVIPARPQRDEARRAWTQFTGGDADLTASYCRTSTSTTCFSVAPPGIHGSLVITGQGDGSWRAVRFPRRRRPRGTRAPGGAAI